MEEMARRGMSSGTVVHPISMVREQVRDVDKARYTPQSVPIGPYHVGCSSPDIEKRKLCYVGFLQTLSEKRTEGGLTGLAEELEPQVRECYPGGVGHMKPEELSRMLLRDACYLLTCMVNYVELLAAADDANNKLAHSKDDDDTVAHAAAGGDNAQDDGGSSTTSEDNTVVRDTMFLAENQIPFFVLQKIHERVTGDTTSSVLEHIAVYVQKVLQVQLYISKKRRPTPPPPTSHLVHLLHAYLQPTSQPQGAMERAKQGRWRRATEYSKYVGIKQRVFKKDEHWTILDVRFQGGTLWVPRLHIDDNTWTILRNLIALEEQIPRRPVTAYCVFMSQVACKEEDVKLLVDKGILEHFLARDEEVAEAFADLCKGVVFDVNNPERNYLKPTWHKMQERCQNRVHRFRVWFCEFRHIGATIALLAALTVSACQVTQTFYAVSNSRGGQQTNH
ncbi:unnamed protein product [Urochloa humidicola]